MVLPDAIEQACQILKQNNANWGIDESADLEHAPDYPLGKLAHGFVCCDEENSYRQLAWLAMFAARRAKPLLGIILRSQYPHFAVEAMKNWLVYRESPNSWQALSEQPPPSYRGKLIEDCRYCDTSCAAASVAEAVRFIISSKPLVAMSAVSCADGAFDQSPLGSGDNFRNWIVDIAIPAAYQQRELSITEEKP